MTRDQALERIAKPEMDEHFLKQEFEYVAHKLDLTVDDLQAEWFEGRSRVGLTAGASAPDVLVQAVITRLRAMGAVSLRTLDGVQEHIKFPLPKGLKADNLE
jgi:4-hydroxy-3-methylbut-2-enyl diphosphate reductase